MWQARRVRLLALRFVCCVTPLTPAGQQSYCSSECQRGDWKQHRDRCKRSSKQLEKKPSGTLGACVVCGQPGQFQCSRCTGPVYCSASCQRQHWRAHCSECRQGAPAAPAPAPASAPTPAPAPAPVALVVAPAVDVVCCLFMALLSAVSYFFLCVAFSSLTPAPNVVAASRRPQRRP